MDHQSLRKGLLCQGYCEVYEWTDEPNFFYEPHSHETDTALIVLAGEITITCDGVPKKYGVGDKIVVPARVIHSARVGPRGARYLVGEDKK